MSHGACSWWRLYSPSPIVGCLAGVHDSFARIRHMELCAPILGTAAAAARVSDRAARRRTPHLDPPPDYEGRRTERIDRLEGCTVITCTCELIEQLSGIDTM